MSRPLLLLCLLVGAAVVATGVIVVKTMSAAGQFTTIRPLGTDACREVGGIAGAEDVAIDREARVAYVSATDRAALLRGEQVRGAIATVDLTRPDLTFVVASGRQPEDFRPHGISLWISPQGERRLFAVNHRSDGSHTVEIFRVSPDGLSHLSTVRHPMFTSPNDIHAVGPEQFYVTNDGEGGTLRRLLDFAFQRLRSNVVYHDGTAARLAAEEFGFANGINASLDGGTLYVADTFVRRLRFFAVDRSDGTLTESGSLFFGTGLDNIDVDADGTLWIAAHPKLMDLVMYVAGWQEQSPSQVVRAVPAAGGGGEARTVLLDMGDGLSAASVAARYRDRLLVGAVMEPKMLLCTVGASGT